MRDRIALSGKMASGKTTCSKYLIQRYGYQVVSFAEPIKRIVEGWFQRYSQGAPYGHTTKSHADYKVYMEHALYHILVDIFLEDHVKASRAMDILLEDVFPQYMDIDWSIEKNDKWRECLQVVGGGRIRQEIDNDVWVNYMVAKLDPDGFYICDDLRHTHEQRVLAENGFTNIRLDMSPEEQIKRLEKIYGTLPYERLNHISETDLDNTAFPYKVDGNQDLIWVLHDLVSIVEGVE